MSKGKVEVVSKEKIEKSQARDWSEYSPAELQEALKLAIAAEERKIERLKSLQDASMSNFVPLKKIVSEPKLLSQWLVEQSLALHYIDSERPILRQMMNEFSQRARALGDSRESIQHLIEGKARRMARGWGYSIRKGKAPYGANNHGLFRILNTRGDTFAGHDYDHSAEDVIALFRSNAFR